MNRLQSCIVLPLTALVCVACGPAATNKNDNATGVNGTISGGVTGTITKAGVSASNVSLNDDFKGHVDIAADGDDNDIALTEPAGVKALLSIGIAFKGDPQTKTYTDTDQDVCANALMQSTSSNDFYYRSEAPIPCDAGGASTPLGSFKLTLTSVTGPDDIGSYVVHGSYSTTVKDTDETPGADATIAVTF